jgi:hypothetical protein
LCCAACVVEKDNEIKRDSGASDGQNGSSDAQLADANQNPPDGSMLVDAAVDAMVMIEPCSFEGTELWGSVYITPTFRTDEIKVQFVSALADINVSYTNSSVQATSCGRWFETTNLVSADFIIREVTALPDIKVCTIGDSCGAGNLPGLTGNTSLPK